MCVSSEHLQTLLFQCSLRLHSSEIYKLAYLLENALAEEEKMFLEVADYQDMET